MQRNFVSDSQKPFINDGKRQVWHFDVIMFRYNMRSLAVYTLFCPSSFILFNQYFTLPLSILSLFQSCPFLICWTYPYSFLKTSPALLCFSFSCRLFTQPHSSFQFWNSLYLYIWTFTSTRYFTILFQLFSKLIPRLTISFRNRYVHH